MLVNVGHGCEKAVECWCTWCTYYDVIKVYKSMKSLWKSEKILPLFFLCPSSFPISEQSPQNAKESFVAPNLRTEHNLDHQFFGDDSWYNSKTERVHGGFLKYQYLKYRYPKPLVFPLITKSCQVCCGGCPLSLWRVWLAVGLAEGTWSSSYGSCKQLPPALRVPNYDEADLQYQHDPAWSSMLVRKIHVMWRNSWEISRVCWAPHPPLPSQTFAVCKQWAANTHWKPRAFVEKSGIPHLMALLQC